MRWPVLASLGFGLLWAAHSPSWAGFSIPPPPADLADVARPHFRAFGVKEGLPHGTVYEALEDRDGRLWVATREGLARYDGQRWHPVPLPAASPSQVVRTLAETPDGSLWAGTEHAGLWRLKDGAWTSIRQGESLPSDRVNRLHVARGPGTRWTLWIGTSAGAVRYQDGRWTTFDTSSGLGSAWIWRFIPYRMPDGADAFVAATLKGFYRLEGSRWIPFKPVPGFPEGEVNDIAQVRQADGTTHLWVTEWGKGVSRWDGMRWERFEPGRGFPSQFPVDLCPVQDPSGGWTLWAATYDTGLAWFRHGRWWSLDAEHGLSARGVYFLGPSRLPRPTLWAGLRDGGLVAVDMSGWRSLDRSFGLPDDEILAFAETEGAQGSPVPWIGTGRGIVRWEQGRWQVDDSRQGLPNNRVQALAVQKDSQGRTILWAGTRKGLARWDGRAWAPHRLVPPPPDEQVQSLLATRDEDGSEVLWIGMEEALVRLKQGRAETFPKGDGVSLDHVYDICETSERGGRSIWFGTRGNGLFRLRSGRWTHYGAKDGIPNPSVAGFHEQVDRQGRRWLWAGTAGGGLLRCPLDEPDARWEVFTRETLPGLPTDVILSVTGDAPDRIFLGTQAGVVRLHFDDPANPTRPAWAQTYTLGDGLPSLSCSGGALRFDRKGFLWVGTSQGAALLHPGREVQLPRPERVLLDAVRVDGKRRELAPGAVLSHRENRLVFEFSLPQYHREADAAFRSQLLGLDPEPLPWTREGRRELSGLPAGRYVLRIEGRDHLGRPTPPLEFPFSIRSAPWVSPLAFALYAMLLAAGILLFIRLREQRLRAHNLELQERIREATAEIELRRRELEQANLELVDLNESLRRANEEKDQFMGIAAHDLRNPLNAILLMGQDLGDGEADGAVVTKFGKSIERLSWQMTQIIKNFLQVNLIDSRRLEVHPACVELTSFVMDVRADFHERARLKDIELVAEMPPEGLMVMVDPSHLRSIMDNFVSNAIKFTPSGPPVRHVWIRLELDLPELRLEVQDEGPGMTAEDQAAAFRRFSKLSAKPTAGETSTGLGLSITKNLAEAMGGRIELESEPGKGATFRVILPVRPPEPMAEE